MMAPSKALGLALLLGACADGQVVTVAPYPREYSCAEQAAAGRELRALGADSVLAGMVADYGKERRELRKVHGMPEPKPCKRVSVLHFP